MSKEEEHLLKEFSDLVTQCRKNIAGDSPSRDDVIIVFAHEYVKGLKKLVAEKDYKLDIAETRIAKLTKSKSIGITDEH